MELGAIPKRDQDLGREERRALGEQVLGLLLDYETDRELELLRDREFALAMVAVGEEGLANSQAVNLETLKKKCIELAGPVARQQLGIANIDDLPDDQVVAGLQLSQVLSAVMQTDEFAQGVGAAIDDLYAGELEELDGLLNSLVSGSFSSLREFARGVAESNFLMRRSQIVPKKFQAGKASLELDYGPGQTESTWDRLVEVLTRHYEDSQPIRDLFVKMVYLAEYEAPVDQVTGREAQLEAIEEIKLRAIPLVFESAEAYVDYQKRFLRSEHRVMEDVERVLQESKSFTSPPREISDTRKRFRDMVFDRYVERAEAEAERAFAMVE